MVVCLCVTGVNPVVLCYRSESHGIVFLCYRGESYGVVFLCDVCEFCVSVLQE